jgi:uncharacterized protein involved in exopolysaccharide biosynthesis
MEVQEKHNQVSDEISLKELILKLQEWWKFLLSKWKTILIAGILGGALGLTYAIIKKPIYTAEATFVLEEGESVGGLGQFAGLASVVGIDLGGGGGGVFEGDNILELYKSRKMIEKTLLSKDTFNNKIDLLVNRYIEFNDLRDDWKDKIKTINFNIPKNEFTLQHDSLINQFVKDFNKSFLDVSKPEKKLSIIKVAFKSKDELFAKSFTNNIVENVNEFYVKTKTKKSSENLAILQNQADSVKNVLNSSLRKVASSVDANPNINSVYQKLRVPTQERQVDVQASGAVYQEIIKNLELAKVTFRREKPLIQVIDEPILPLINNKMSKVILIILGGVILVFLTVLFLIIRNSLRSIIVN